MKYLEILRGRLDELTEQRQAAFAEMEAITERAVIEKRSELDDDETSAFDELRDTVRGLDEEIVNLKERVDELEKLAERASNVKDVPNVIRRTAPTDILEDRSATPAQLRDALVRSVADHLGDGPEVESVRRMVARHGDDAAWTRRMLARSSDVYQRAFTQLIMSGGNIGLLEPEEQRAIKVGVDTAGGYFVPTVMDPTLIYTNTGTSNMIRQVARVITLTGAANAYNPITTAGITASWDDELEEVSDDAPELATSPIPIHRAQMWVPYSREAEMDIPGLEQELRSAMFDAKDRLEAAAHATGSGTGEPTGIFTALDANTNVELQTTTAATVGLVDIHNVYRQVPIRWRRNGHWIMNPLWLGAIRQLGSAVGASFTGDLREPFPEVLLGKPVVEVDEAPSTQTTTALDNILAFGDPKTYVILDKPGSMAIDFIPHVFGATNSRPIGARGLYAFWRNGGDVVVDTAWRLLQDKTSA